MARLDEAELEAQLKGKTLQIYWFMLRGGGRGFGVREIQRALNLSSPSLAAHHLEKLKSLGLVEKTPTGEYVVSKEVKVGFLKFFFIPRLIHASLYLLRNSPVKFSFSKAFTSVSAANFPVINA